MPELPEVETIIRGINAALQNQRLERVWISPYFLRKIDPKLPTLSGQKLHEIKRIGKYLLFVFDTKGMLGHLGMSGKFLFIEKNTPLPKHTHATFLYEGEQLLAFVDPRRFGGLSVGSLAELRQKLPLGIEPLSEEFTPKVLYEKLQKTSQPIKAFLLNQQHVLGIGNIYASEALFASKIAPTQPCHSISKAVAQKLHCAIVHVLTQAIQHGGSSLSQSGYKNVHALPGTQQNFLLVYGKKDIPCLNCQTAIQKIWQQQRSTYFCPVCQKETAKEI